MELIGGQESTNLLFWIRVTVGWAGGRGIAAHAGVGQRLKGSTSKPPKRDKAGDLGACWSTSRGRGCGSKVILHTVRVRVESGARVEQQRAVLRRAWFRRRLGSSRVSEAGRKRAVVPKPVCSWSHRTVESRAAGG